MGKGLNTVIELIAAGYPESVAVRIASGALPMDSASKRARAVQQDYDPTDVQYHGSASDIKEFIPSKNGALSSGVYTTSSPELASEYAGLESGSVVYPLLTRKGAGNISRDEYLARNRYATIADLPQLNSNLRNFENITGIDDVATSNVASRGDEAIRNTFDPRDIRSVNAAFDPEYSGPNILGAGATLGTAGLLGAATLQSEDADASMVGLVSKIGQASQDMLGMAKKMQATGMNAEDIWSRTGWNQGVDGLWRTEHTNHDNTKLNLDKLNKDGSNTLTLEEAIDDPVLLSSYEGESPLMLGELENEGYASEPTKLKDYRIRFNSEMKEDGRFSPFSGVLEINPNQRESQIREVILHELQHTIQGLEGFSDGANPERIKAVIRNPNASDQNVGYYNSLFGRKVPSNLSDDDAFKAYRRNAGEVEAEAVVYRDQLGRMYGDEYGYDPRERAPEEVEIHSGASSRELQNPFSYDDFSDEEMELYGQHGGRFKRNEKNLATGLGLLGAATAASADEGEQVAAEMTDQDRYAADVQRAQQMAQSDDPAMQQRGQAWLDQFGGMASEDDSEPFDANYNLTDQPLWLAQAGETFLRDIGGAVSGMFDPETGREIRENRTLPATDGTDYLDQQFYGALGTALQPVASGIKRVADMPYNAQTVQMAANPYAIPMPSPEMQQDTSTLNEAIGFAAQEYDKLSDRQKRNVDRFGNTVETASYILPAAGLLRKYFGGAN